MSALGGDLSVREKARGGSVVGDAKENPPGWMRLRSRILILVHGYNNSLCAGCASYDHFLKRVPRGFPTVGRFFWPGDSRPAFLSGLAYPFKIDTAIESARALAEALGRLADRSVPLEIYFVGHSLGCRVILEALKASGEARLLRHVRAVCLMAAAVPVGFLEKGGRLEGGATRVSGRLVLYSHSDGVLRWSFPAGQVLAAAMGKGAGTSEASREAVGRRGNPVSFPTDSAHMTGNGHSDYWKDPRIFKHIAPLMGVAVERRIERRPLPVHGPPPPVSSLIRRTSRREIRPLWVSQCDDCG